MVATATAADEPGGERDYIRRLLAHLASSPSAQAAIARAVAASPTSSQLARLAASSASVQRALATAVGASPTSSQLAAFAASSVSVRRMLAEALAASAPSLEAIARLDRVSDRLTEILTPSDADTASKLELSADFFSRVDAAGRLKEESPALLRDPESWLTETEAAASAGDARANEALLLVRYLFQCFFLLARRLNPSAQAVERLGSIMAVSVLLAVITGTMYANSPKMLEKVNNVLSSPVGIIGLFFSAQQVAAELRSRKRKPSKPRSGNSKPNRRRFRRVL